MAYPPELKYILFYFCTSVWTLGVRTPNSMSRNMNVQNKKVLILLQCLLKSTLTASDSPHVRYSPTVPASGQFLGSLRSSQSDRGLGIASTKTESEVCEEICDREEIGEMAESMDKLLTAEFKEAFDEFDKVGSDDIVVSDLGLGGRWEVADPIYSAHLELEFEFEFYICFKYSSYKF
jgi:hypothetical protein